MLKEKKHGLPVQFGNGMRREFFRRDHQRFNRLDIIIEWLQEEHCVEWCNNYGEPGYTQPEAGVLFANWNNIPKKFQTYLEGLGYELEWSDEWTIDYDNSKAYRTEPNGWWWEPSFIYTEGGDMLTPDCSPSEIIEAVSMLTKRSKVQFVPKWITPQNLIDEGYSSDLRDYEGRRDDKSEEPEKIVKAIWADDDLKIDRLVLRRTNGSQVYDLYEVWVLLEEEEE